MTPTEGKKPVRGHETGQKRKGIITPTNKTMTSQQQFIEKYRADVITACKGTGIFPSVKMAQLILETGWGKSIKHAGNNLFGIKAGKSWPGKVISNTTHEIIDGKKVIYQGTNQIYDNRAAAISAGANYVTLFRAYYSPADSINDHSAFLLTLDRYKPVINAATYDEQCRQLKACGYATATDYPGILISIIKKYELFAMDSES